MDFNIVPRNHYDDEASVMVYDVKAEPGGIEEGATPAGICVDVAYGKKGKYVTFVIPNAEIARYIQSMYDVNISDVTISFSPKVPA